MSSPTDLYRCDKCGAEWEGKARRGRCWSCKAGVDLGNLVIQDSPALVATVDPAFWPEVGE